MTLLLITVFLFAILIGSGLAKGWLLRRCKRMQGCVAGGSPSPYGLHGGYRYAYTVTFVCPAHVCLPPLQNANVAALCKPQPETAARCQWILHSRYPLAKRAFSRIVGKIVLQSADVQCLLHFDA